MYECKKCNKSFEKRHAYIGHCSSHKPRKRMPIEETAHYKKKNVNSKHICPFCRKEHSNGVQLGGHMGYCSLNPNKRNLSTSFKGHHHTKESKLKLSIRRKEFLNKNKHNWSKYHSKESDPEKKFKRTLKELKVKYKQEYTPKNSKYFYRIDFAIVKNKIGFEINGNQHYTKTGRLKKYYKLRQKYLESLGWEIINIHYSVVYRKEEIIKIIKNTLMV